MTLPVTITGLSTAVAPVGPFKRGGMIPMGVTTVSALGIAVYGAQWQGQSFTTGPDQTVLYSVSAYVAKNGAPADTMRAVLYATDVSGNPTGAALTTTAVTAAGISTSLGWVTFVLAVPYNVAPNTQYAIVFNSPASTGFANGYTVSFDTTGPGTYAGGLALTSTNSGSAWAPYVYTSAQGDLLVTASLNGTGTAGTDAYYFFARDGTTATTLQAFKATDPTTSWASAANKTGFTTAILNLTGYQVGNVIHLLVMDGTANTLVANKYLSYDMATDTFLATVETVKAASNITPFGSFAAGVGHSLVVRSTGEVVAFFNGTQTKTSGTFYSRVYYSRRTAVNTWSAAVEVDPNTASDSYSPAATLGVSDTVHFIFALSGGMNQRTLSAANALQTASTALANYAGSSVPGLSRAQTYVRGATTKIAVSTMTSGNITAVAHFDSANTPTLVGSNVQNAPSGAIGAARYGRVLVDGTDIWFIFPNTGGDLDVYVNKSTDDGATWGSAINAFAATNAGTDQTLSIDADIYQRGSASVVLPYLVNDGGVWKYNEYLVRALTFTGTGALQAAPLTRTNLQLQSQTFDSATWAKQGLGTLADNTAAPDGTFTADRIGNSSVNQQHYLTGGVTVAPGGLTTTSIYAKAGTTGWVQLSYLGPTVNFNLTTGQVGWIASGPHPAPSVEDAGNGWWRCKMPASGQSGNYNLYIIPLLSDVQSSNPSYQGSAENIFLWGAQYEAGDVATDYIQTVTVPVTVPTTITGKGVVSWLTQANAWNPNDKGSNVTLSNNNKTVTSVVTAVNNNAVRSTTTNNATARYVEFLVNATPGNNNVGVGFKSISSVLGSQIGSFMVSGNSWYINGSYAAMLAYPTPPANGDVVSFYWDPAADRVWARLNNGIWNNTVGADPVAGTGGLDVSSVVGTDFALWFLAYNVGDSITLRAEKADFTQTQPTGTVLSWTGETLVIPDQGILVSGPSSVAGSGIVGSVGTGALQSGSSFTTTNFGISSSTGTGALTAVASGRTNYLPWSERAEMWSATIIAPTSNATTAPDGSNNADKIAVANNSTNAAHYIYNWLVPGSGINTCTYSFYLKASGNYTWVQLYGLSGWANFNLTGAGATGNKSAGATSVITGPDAYGFYRCSLTMAGAGGSTQFAVCLMRTDNASALPAYLPIDTTDSAYVWGGQVEVGSVATAYIPTTTAAASSNDTLVGTGAVSWNATGVLAPAAAATLSGAGQVTSPPVTGTGVLTSTVTTLVSNGVSGSVGTSVLAPAISTLTGAGLSLVTFTAAISASTSTLAAVGLSTSRQTSAALVPTQSFASGSGQSSSSVTSAALVDAAATIVGLGTGGIATGTGTLTTATAALVASGSVITPPAIGTGALTTTGVTLSGAGLPIWVVTGTLTSGIATAAGVGVSQVIATGTLVPSVAQLAGSGTAAFIPRTGDGVLACSISTLTSFGTVASTGTGVLTPTVSTASGAGKSSVTFTAAISAAAAVMVAPGLSTSTGPGILQAQTNFLRMGDGLSSSAGTGALTSTSTMLSSGVSSSSGSAILPGTISTVVGAGQTFVGVTGVANLLPAASSLAAVGKSFVVGSGAPSSLGSTMTGTGGLFATGTGALPGSTSTLAAAGVAAMLGSGALATQGAAITSAGFARWSGTGALSSSGSALSGSGQISFAANGALAASVATVTGAGQTSSRVTSATLQASVVVLIGTEGVVTIAGTGSLPSQSAQVDGAGRQTSLGTGVLVGPAAALAGAGLSRAAGTGSLLSQACVLAALGKSSVTGTGVLALTGSELTGTGTVAAGVLGSGVLLSTAATATGAGARTWIATGALQAQASKLTATGASRWVGTGTLAGQVSTLAATGQASWRATGALVPAKATVVSSGQSSSMVTTAAIQAALATVNGSEGVVIIRGDGDLPAQSSRTVGAGIGRSFGTGSLRVLDSADVVGVGTSTLKGTGNLTAGRSAVTGVGGILALGSGVLTSVSKVAGAGYSRWVGGGVLPAGLSRIASTGVVSAVGTGALKPSHAILVGPGQIGTSGVAALVPGRSRLYGTGLVQTKIVGIGTLTSKPSRIYGWGVETAYGYGDLRPSPANVSGDDIAKGFGVIAADASQIVGTGYIELPAYPVPTEFPGSYPGTTTWHGHTAVWRGHTALPGKVPPPWWSRGAA